MKQKKKLLIQKEVKKKKNRNKFMQRNRGHPVPFPRPLLPFFSRRSNDRLACPRLAPLEFEWGAPPVHVPLRVPLAGSDIDASSSEFFLEQHGGEVELRRNGKETAARSRELKKKRTLSRVLKINEEWVGASSSFVPSGEIHDIFHVLNEANGRGRFFLSRTWRDLKSFEDDWKKFNEL